MLIPATTHTLYKEFVIWAIICKWIWQYIMPHALFVSGSRLEITMRIPPATTPISNAFAQTLDQFGIGNCLHWLIFKNNNQLIVVDVFYFDVIFF